MNRILVLGIAVVVVLSAALSADAGLMTCRPVTCAPDTGARAPCGLRSRLRPRTCAPKTCCAPATCEPATCEPAACEPETCAPDTCRPRGGRLARLRAGPCA